MGKIPFIQLLFVCSLLSAADALADKDDPEVLSPIHINDFESATGFTKRDGASAFDFLHHDSETHLAYGRPSGK